MPRILTPADIAGFRDRLCEVAARLFAEKGREGFNMRDLAQQVGVSAMTPYRYFEDKDEILTVLKARAFGRLADQLEMANALPGTPTDKGVAIGHAYCRFALEEQTYYRLMFDLSQPGARTSPELDRQEHRARAAMMAHAQLLVIATLQDGDPELIAEMLWSTLHGAASLHLSGRLDAIGLDRLVRQTMMIHLMGYVAMPHDSAQEWRSVA
ncbi:MAG TPA: TetR/AcrR family transcriptional regulator [Rhizomicrobium sp.]|jgi:AcrR family transcriptional regulator